MLERAVAEAYARVLGEEADLAIRAVLAFISADGEKHARVLEDPRVRRRLPARRVLLAHGDRVEEGDGGSGAGGRFEGAPGRLR